MIRYFGFDPSYDDSADDMKGHTFSAHWINLLNNELIEAVGGIDAIENVLPNADIRKLNNGVFIRGAKLPPIGDINRGANDIGCLPDVARLLQPTRIELSGFGSPDFDPMPWLARYDEMTSR
ncbi:MAG: type VI immunity family protein [bacterium]